MNRTIIIIIGIICAFLGAWAIAATSKSLYSTKKGYTKTFIANIEMALELYKEDNGIFPTTEQGLNALLKKPIIQPIPENWYRPYCNRVTDVWGNPIQYRYPSIHPPNKFDLYSLGHDKIEGADDINNWTNSKKEMSSEIIVILLSGLLLFIVWLLVFLPIRIILKYKRSNNRELFKLLDDKKAVNRKLAIKALGMVDNKESIPQIKRLLNDKDQLVREESESSLKKLGVTDEEIQKAKESK